ncbi:MAG: hypothetical protein ACI9Y1_002485, partial [Lentisphaeria bacterium]
MAKLTKHLSGNVSVSEQLTDGFKNQTLALLTWVCIL